jgi:Protein of unknown function, DUF481
LRTPVYVTPGAFIIEAMPSPHTLRWAGAHAPALSSSAALRSVPKSFAPGLVALVCAALFVLPAAAQSSSKPPKTWQGSALVNASIFFGNTQQQVFGTDAKLARVDSSFGLSTELQSIYGEATVKPAPSTVTKRLWIGMLTANLRPLARVSGFVTGSYQSNLEKRIASRSSGGVGAMWNIRQTDATGASLSLSLSAEHTVPMDSTVTFPDQWIARFSWVAKFHHSFDDRVDFTHSTSWQPAAHSVSQYLVASSTELRFKMNTAVSLSVAFTDSYDSAAMSRGARTNNDGEMLFGIAAGW